MLRWAPALLSVLGCGEFGFEGLLFSPSDFHLPPMVLEAPVVLQRWRGGAWKWMPGADGCSKGICSPRGGKTSGEWGGRVRRGVGAQRGAELPVGC